VSFLAIRQLGYKKNSLVAIANKPTLSTITNSQNNKANIFFAITVLPLPHPIINLDKSENGVFCKD